MIQPNNPPNNPYGQPQGRNPYRQSQRPRKRRDPGCLPWLALFALLGGGAWLLSQYLQTNQSFVSFYMSNFILMAVIDVVLLFVPVILVGMLGRTVLKRVGFVVWWISWWILLVDIMFFGGFNPRIDLTRTGFSMPFVAVAFQNKVTFDNPSDGVTQILCLGTDQHCDPNAGDPSQLAHGLVIQPGQSVSIVFDYTGHIYITSKTTPHMNLDILVVKPAQRQTGHS